MFYDIFFRSIVHFLFVFLGANEYPANKNVWYILHININLDKNRAKNNNVVYIYNHKKTTGLEFDIRFS